MTLKLLATIYNHFKSFNLFARWVDPQFDKEELGQEAVQEENSSPRTEESPRILQEGPINVVVVHVYCVGT